MLTSERSSERSSSEYPVKTSNVLSNSLDYSGRYIILLMGAFSIYTGFIYNDIFSKSLDIWQSGWDWPDADEGIAEAQPNGVVYPFGLDPGWHGADNALIFTNSYKMKMSIVLGVIHVCTFVNFSPYPSLNSLQMTFALCLQIPNHIRFHRTLDIWTSFIPQLLFLQSIFGYLVVCIIYKWTVDWSQAEAQPPSLLNMLIAMFLSPGTIPADSHLYSGQGFVQIVLVLVALICVPWMLCVKPYLQYKEMSKIQGQGYQGVGQGDGPDRANDDVLEGEEEGNGRAIAENADDEEHVSRSLLTLVICFVLMNHVGATRFRRGGYPPDHSHNRILSRMHLPHGVLSSSLGSLSRPRPTLRSLVGHDTRKCASTLR